MGGNDGLQEKTFVLVTGANSGLGFSICCRLIDEFLSTRPENRSLTIIFTTRSTRKGDETSRRLKDHLRRSAGGRSESESRITLQPENVDLTNLLSVRALSRKLLTSTPKIDSLVLNAGIGGFTGLNWPKAVYTILTDLVHASTWPSYKLSDIGVMGKKQTSSPKERPLGEIFCANVFGHYMLAHGLVPLLSRAESSGRIIWISSLEGLAENFDISDIQGIRSPTAYESSKRLTDLLALTSNLPSTAPWVNNFLSNPSTDTSSDPPSKPNMYVAHPGICGTSIVPLILPLQYCMLAAFWLARMLGSPWHGVSPYVGARAPVWLSLATQSALDTAESAYSRLGGGKVKWGSGCDRSGRDFAASTEVDGWGHGGVVGGFAVEEDRLRRRRRGQEDVNDEKKVEFEEMGRECWRELEALRVEWEGILDEEEAKN
ncbi:3-keto-steroid reductase [Arachnomyces sp. PD_36]|nr:3-keto-steroid reductase [Arachnomyces sp. PD_36]